MKLSPTEIDLAGAAGHQPRLESASGPGLVAKQSSVRIIYPFQFDAQHFSAHSEAIDGAVWSTGKKQFHVWQRPNMRTDNLLRHVSEFLGPKQGNPASATAHVWHMRSEALNSYHGLWARIPWQFKTRRSPDPRRFQIEDIELMIFNTGIGFLAVGAGPESENVDDWLDFCNNFRIHHNSNAFRVRAIAHSGTPGENAIHPAPAHIQKDLSSDGFTSFVPIITTILNSGRLDKNDQVAWWEDINSLGRLVSFAVLYVDGLPEEHIAHLLYRVRHFFHAEQGGSPAPEDLEIDDDDAYQPYASKQWFFHSVEGGGFVACDAPATGSQGAFFRDTLPSHLAQEYFLLFLIVLHQYFELTSLSEKVALHAPLLLERIDDSESNRLIEQEKQFDLLRAELLAFTTRSHFSQIARYHHHHRFYQRWQETMMIDQLYREVRNEIREVHDHLLLRSARRAEELQATAAAREEAIQGRFRVLEMLVGVLTIVVGFPSLAFAFVGATGAISRTDGLIVLVAAWAVGVLLCAPIYMLWRTRWSK